MNYYFSTTPSYFHILIIVLQFGEAHIIQDCTKSQFYKKRAIRIIDHKPFLYPSSELFVKYGILRMPELVVQQGIVILLAFLNGTLAPLLSKLFSVNRPLSTRTTEHFPIPFSRHNYRTSSLAFTAPKTWNSVIGGMFLKLADVPRSKTTLKKLVKTELLKKYLK